MRRHLRRLRRQFGGGVGVARHLGTHRTKAEKSGKKGIFSGGAKVIRFRFDPGWLICSSSAAFSDTPSVRPNQIYFDFIPRKKDGTSCPLTSSSRCAISFPAFSLVPLTHTPTTLFFLDSDSCDQPQRTSTQSEQIPLTHEHIDGR